ncbi:protein-L-isoaspartate(D-aspartate) O-methyltransferase [Halorubrum alkaliphilum]|uniref:protein-L-isoaspartate(D-aspartate) O-methyltransferase n=1 Tax=Halorubrum alkaliphilum TaxID=261290 RepID=A0A8T4GFR2_9EURY|nr:methyltransferase [Halorubrum alkaliphilum]MBP1922973.1 protein-L-isoaspartate(D-aspartate) O-methyltransferase [Halorubrum alkaliphilum]
MDESALRTDMIEGLEHQIGEPLGASVLSALQAVPRETFVDDTPYANRASEEAGTRALAPATVARMLMTLDADDGDEVLLVGAGIGYTVATLSEIVGPRHVHAVDIDRNAVTVARSNLDDAGYGAALVDRRDGAGGLPEYAPYDRILVETAVVTPPRALREQLADGGRIVYPRGSTEQTIVAVERESVAGDTRDARAAAGRDHNDAAPDGFRTVETAGPVRLDPMLVDGEQAGVERNRTRREDAEIERQGHFARTGWEQEWIDWDDRI